jgi:hypothetical protein
LENFIDSVNDLLPASISQTDNATPITTTHVLLICYVALQILEPPKALQHVDKWRTLFRALTDLGDHSLGVVSRTEPATSLVDNVNAQGSPQPNPIQYTTQPGQFTGAEFEQVQELVKLCLQNVQRHDIHVLGLGYHPRYLRYMTSLELDKVYKEWLPIFASEHSVIEDRFVEMLGRIFKLATLDIPGDERVLQYFRLRKLGILESNRPESAQAVDHGTAATNDEQNDGFQNDDDSRDVGDAKDNADGDQRLPVE